MTRGGPLKGREKYLEILKGGGGVSFPEFEKGGLLESLKKERMLRSR